MNGTNSVQAVGDAVAHATNVSWPLIITILTGLVALGVFLKVGGRASLDGP